MTIQVLSPPYIKPLTPAEKAKREAKKKVNAIINGTATPSDFAIVSDYLKNKSNTDEIYKSAISALGTEYDFGTYVEGSTLYNSTDVEINRHIIVRLIGVCHDDLSDGSGKVGFTFMHTHVVPYAYQMNDSNTNSGGGQNSKMRITNLGSTGEIWTSYPTTLTTDGIVKAVNKMTNNTGNDNSTSAVTATSDKLGILSVREVYASTSVPYSAEGDQYEYFQNLGITESNYSPLKNLTIYMMNNKSNYASHQGSLRTGYGGLRSPYTGNTSSFEFVNLNSINSSLNASIGIGLAPCFCI